MNALLAMFEKIEAIQASGVLLKPEDYAFIHDIDNRVCGMDTMVITPAEQQRVADIHMNIFSKAMYSK